MVNLGMVNLSKATLLNGKLFIYQMAGLQRKQTEKVEDEHQRTRSGC